MKLLRVNLNIRPPGGYYFLDEEGMRHEAEDLITLIGNVAMYRERTGRDYGDPVNEIQNQILERSPQVRQK